MSKTIISPHVIKSSFLNAGLVTEENTLPPKENIFQQVNYTVSAIGKAKSSAAEIYATNYTKVFQCKSCCAWMANATLKLNMAVLKCPTHCYFLIKFAGVA